MKKKKTFYIDDIAQECLMDIWIYRNTKEDDAKNKSQSDIICEAIIDLYTKLHKDLK